MLSLAVYFRGLRAIVLVLLPLAIAIITALAAARVFYGALNLVSAFIFAVLLGLGVDFGIHILARYQAERRRGLALTPRSRSPSRPPASPPPRAPSAPPSPASSCSSPTSAASRTSA